MSEMEDLRDVFIWEARDIIERVRGALDGLMAAGNREGRLNEIFRGVHTIKGGAGACEMKALKDDAHTIEAELVRLKDAPDTLTEAVVRGLQRGIDRLEALVDGAEPPPAIEVAKGEEDPGFGFFDEEPAKAPPPAALPTAAGSPPAEMIRVSLDRIQENFDIISEIFLTRNQMRYLVEQRAAQKLSDEEFFQRWEVLDGALRKNIGELEHVAMAMRMMSVKGLMKRMEKTVLQYSEDSKKAIRVVIVGEQTELDKKILDSLAEPLIHLTRNAMDHGIESAEDRRKAGKPALATIRFEASVAGNEVLLKVVDDGRGIDDQKVLESAKRRGVDVSGIKTKEEAVNLIFLPGLSTKDATSEISGRGVGMDAVRAYVEGFGGSISIHTELGVGTTFTLRLPIGMSVIPAVVVRANDQILALPTSGIIETKTVPAEALVTNAGETFFERNGQFIPCYDLEQFLFVGRKSKRMGGKPKVIPLCICETSSGLVAVRMQELVANVEIVVKSMPTLGFALPYVTGVSILATGEPIYVVSPALLYDRVIRRQRGTGRQNGGGFHEAA